MQNIQAFSPYFFSGDWITSVYAFTSDLCESSIYMYGMIKTEVTMRLGHA